MGAITFSIPKEMVLKIKEKASIDTFVETGTYLGGTCFWAAQHFRTVYTIEINPKISQQTASNPSCPKNINFLIGNSKDILPDLSKKLPDNTFFWLDGHWCGGNTGGLKEDCPIYDEVKAAANCKNASIFIDDARYFLGNLTKDNYYPPIDELFSLLKENFPNHVTTIVEDVIITIPKELKYILDEDWRKYYKYRYTKFAGILGRRFFLKLRNLKKKFKPGK